MNVGDKVRLLPPWGDDQKEYDVVRVNPDGTVGIAMPGYDDPNYPGADFAPEFVEKVP